VVTRLGLVASPRRDATVVDGGQPGAKDVLGVGAEAE
jgi:hypothetical protein